MPALPLCKGKDAVKAFERNGWTLARYIDDHFILTRHSRNQICLTPR